MSKWCCGPRPLGQYFGKTTLDTYDVALIVHRLWCVASFLAMRCTIEPPTKRPPYVLMGTKYDSGRALHESVCSRRKNYGRLCTRDYLQGAYARRSKMLSHLIIFKILEQTLTVQRPCAQGNTGYVVVDLEALHVL